MGYSDLIINRGLGADAVARIAFFQIVPLVTMILPLAVLMGVLVAMGRLGSDLEILSLETLGIRATRLAGPIGLFALVMAALCMWLSLIGAPWANRSLDASLAAMARVNPAAQIRAGVRQEFGSWQLEAREVSARGDEMKSVLLWLPSLGDTVFARTGLLRANDEGGIEMELLEGRVLLAPEVGSRHIEFQNLETTLPESEKTITRRKNEVIKGHPLAQLRELSEREARRPLRYPQATVEIHRRISAPFTTLFFGLIAIPLFLTRKEFSRSAGGVLGLTLIIAYFGTVQLGDGMIQQKLVSPALGVWFPNILVVIVGAWLFSSIARKGVFGREQDRQRGGDQPARAERRYRGPRNYALQRYVAMSFVQFALLSFSILLATYLLIDILDRLQWFARHGAGADKIILFYGARIPVLASRVIPMSLLVGTALTASHLAVQGELMGMRSCGIPAPRALSSVLVLCAMMVPLYFLLNNEVIPAASARQDEIKHREIKSAVEEEDVSPPVWYRIGKRLFQVSMLDDELGVAEGITVYELGPDGLPISRTDAISARHIGRGNWRLRDSRRFELRDGTFVDVEAEPFARLGEELPVNVDTMHFSVGQLREEIADVEANGLDATALRVDLQVKLAAPWACIVLPAIALFFAVGGPPFPSSATTTLVSGGLALVYVLLTGSAASLGYGGAIGPVVAGWGPTGLLTLIALYTAARLRGQGQIFSPSPRLATAKE